jgi:hypothetical protein
MGRSFRRILSLIVVTSLVSGCQIPSVQHAGIAKPAQGCASIARRVMIDPPPAQGLMVGDKALLGPVLQDGDPLVAELDEIYDSAAKGRVSGGAPFLGDEPVSDSMLFLSGGSQNGAFGAGFLSQWAEKREGRGLPRFRVVTGISTGALQSTFAFLDDAEMIKSEYQIPGESRLLKRLSKGDLRSKSKLAQGRAALGLARKGAIADLAPLRERLRVLIDDTILARVAAEAGTPGGPDRRKLFVGAVEMDSGDAYLFDLTEAARGYVGGNTGMRDCYIEALMASSSVPMAALPVFIEGRMYIDGGARFGVISDFTAATMDRVARASPSNAARNLFILVNGTLEAGSRCHLKDCDDHPLPSTPDGEVPQHSSWTFDKLALRSMSVLINQAYRSSVYLARREAKDLKFTPHFARIEGDLWDHPAAIDFDDTGGERLTCKQWEQRDKDIDNPVEFHPRFMRCLIDYGSAHPQVMAWAEAE